MDPPESLPEAIQSLIKTYADLNPSTITELTSEPSPLEFMRYVAQNRPFVVRGGARDWPAARKWDAEYLERVMGDQEVNVAITPLGNADSVTLDHGNNCTYFVKPLERTEPFNKVLSYIRRQELEDLPGVIKYAQTQNDNLPNEYAPLTPDVPPSIPFARIALEQPSPDALNLWIGNSRSVTALHKDGYENIYVQIAGEKHFVLLPPSEAACVNETRVRGATYVHSSVNGKEEDGSDRAEVQEGHEEKRVEDENKVERMISLDIQPDEPEEYIPFPTWDPDIPAKNATPYSHLSKPMRVSLQPGDMLYLPALWYVIPSPIPSLTTPYPRIQILILEQVSQSVAVDQPRRHLRSRELLVRLHLLSPV
ncbi:MAG: hypothetical protein M1819_005111 [Sarea resinae]|nr:MAG: hypothetical protein M1819_005111 [Sarea resinae]